MINEGLLALLGGLGKVLFSRRRGKFRLQLHVYCRQAIQKVAIKTQCNAQAHEMVMKCGAYVVVGWEIPIK